MKVLIISHNCFSTYNNMGKTFTSLFSVFKKEELCQLYIHPTIPDIDKCNSYFRITDIDALKGIIKLNVTSNIYTDENIILEKNITNSQLQFNNKIKNKKSVYKKILRDYIWDFSPWFNKNIKNWLDSQNPTHIFIAPGRNIFFYNIALKISKYLNIPIITYICDDYYFNNTKMNILEKKYQMNLMKKTEKLMNKTSTIITICDELSESYQKHFNVNCEKIMTGIDIDEEIENKYNNSIKNISFFGNITNNRYLNLYDIGIALDNINKKYNTEITLNIYSKNISETMIKLLKKSQSIKIKDFVTGDKYEIEKQKSDAYIHTEAFDEKNIDLVKNSISTKIPECLNSGKCLIAYGPDNVASIRYLKKNNCAIVINDKDKIEEELYNIITNEEKRKEIINNEIEIGKKNHNSKKNSKKLYNIIINKRG